MDIKEAEQLVREDKCEGCKGTVFGYDCSMEDDCEDFRKEVKQTLKDEKYDKIMSNYKNKCIRRHLV